MRKTGLPMAAAALTMVAACGADVTQDAEGIHKCPHAELEGEIGAAVVRQLDPANYNVQDEAAAVSVLDESGHLHGSSVVGEFGLWALDHEQLTPGWLIEVEGTTGVDLFVVDAQTSAVQKLFSTARRAELGRTAVTFPELYSTWFGGETFFVACGQKDSANGCIHTAGGSLAYAWDVGKAGEADRNDPAVAPVGGCVRVAGLSTSWGATVVIELGITNCSAPSSGAQGFVRVAHFGRKKVVPTDPDPALTLPVVVGQFVKRGQSIGFIGDSGNAKGPHEHVQCQATVSGPSVPCSFKDVGVPQKGKSYRSKNHGVIDEARDRNGREKVGYATTATAVRASLTTWEITFTGGTFGRNAIYYEAKGCVGDRCKLYNNTNFAWLVRTGFFAKYVQMGGPNSWIGAPTSDEYPVSGGARQNFKCGFMSYNAKTGAITVAAYSPKPTFCN